MEQTCSSRSRSSPAGNYTPTQNMVPLAPIQGTIIIICYAHYLELSRAQTGLVGNVTVFPLQACPTRSWQTVGALQWLFPPWLPDIHAIFSQHRRNKCLLAKSRRRCSFATESACHGEISASVCRATVWHIAKSALLLSLNPRYALVHREENPGSVPAISSYKKQVAGDKEALESHSQTEQIMQSYTLGFRTKH